MSEPGSPESLLGFKVHLVMDDDEEAEGVIFAHDPAMMVLVLKYPGSHPGVSSLKFLRTNCIKEIKSAERPIEPMDLTLHNIDLDRIRQREERTLRQAELDMSKFGVGVTKEAQAVFDALSKTMPCRWEDKTVVVLEEVYIDEPYGVDNCRADGIHKYTLERVKKMVGAARVKLGLDESN